MMLQLQINDWQGVKGTWVPLFVSELGSGCVTVQKKQHRFLFHHVSSGTKNKNNKKDVCLNIVI